MKSRRVKLITKAKGAIRRAYATTAAGRGEEIKTSSSSLPSFRSCIHAGHNKNSGHEWRNTKRTRRNKDDRTTWGHGTALSYPRFADAIYQNGRRLLFILIATQVPHLKVSKVEV
jgi:hypothetical protein